MPIDPILARLFERETLNQEQAAALFAAIIRGELPDEQLAAVLIALKLRGEHIDEITGAVMALLDAAHAFPAPDYPFADIVGTGGDGANTINISTAAALTAAALGLKIAKHGSRSVSSQTGASDLLTALGVNIAMPVENARQALDDIGICFLFAPQYHPGFKHAIPVRQSLKTRTIFNILGPLINPARPKRQLLGVYAENLLQPYAETKARLGCEHSIVVHGSGLDEVAIHGKTQVAEMQDGHIDYYELSPADFGFSAQPLETLRGGNPQENAALITALLQGKGKTEHRQAVAMNTALLMKLFGHDNLKHNAEQVLDVLASGKPFDILSRLAQY
ncbi:MAG: anthranilate phosphoribosyltransferase [Cardiobacteriaceae bacterium]|nr:anthranilate phosphoribosyltransferase [Cardiobacteriaceae bacterium]